eukprot:16137342-Heterocapsa_arctica.AAC.1
MATVYEGLNAETTTGVLTLSTLAERRMEMHGRGLLLFPASDVHDYVVNIGRRLRLLPLSAGRHRARRGRHDWRQALRLLVHGPIRRGRERGDHDGRARA